MPKRQCAGKTKAGKACKNTAVLEDGYCVAHTPNTADPRRFEGGAKPGAGRPPNPRVVDVMREKVEANIDRLLAPYFDALDNAVLHATYEGEVVASDVPDLGARMAAAEKLLDRVYGKARQTIAHTGVGDGPPIEVELSSELADAAHQFLDAVRRGRPA